MMKAIKFRLSGASAFFKNPETNMIANFSFDHIHKVALLGLLGAVVGLSGHNIRNLNRIFCENAAEKEKIGLEFYDKLKDLKVSIVPLSDKGYFQKKIVVFNNTTGHANKNSTMNVKEQVIFNPAWDIYLLDDGSIDSDLFEKLKHYLLNKKTVFMPYLGKNEHPANITEVEYVSLDEVQDVEKISSLFPVKAVECDSCETFDNRTPFAMESMLPTLLLDDIGYGGHTNFWFTNLLVNSVAGDAVIKNHGSRTLFFF